MQQDRPEFESVVVHDDEGNVIAEITIGPGGAVAGRRGGDRGDASVLVRPGRPFVVTATVRRFAECQPAGSDRADDAPPPRTVQVRRRVLFFGGVLVRVGWPIAIASR